MRIARSNPEARAARAGLAGFDPTQKAQPDKHRALIQLWRCLDRCSLRSSQPAIYSSALWALGFAASHARTGDRHNATDKAMRSRAATGADLPLKGHRLEQARVGISRLGQFETA